ncbi:MAG: type II toxin-antitoxin system Phd/YefM family antitoxin [Candidatus Paceibacterota bacterium]|jgi:prevent-host-death family protein
MNIKNTLSITEARKKIFDIADDVQKPGSYYTFTENGRPKAVLMSAEEFESWQETLEVMKDFPELDLDAAAADQAVKTGEFRNWATLADMKQRYQMAVADKPNKKYGVHSARKPQSRKKYS